MEADPRRPWWRKKRWIAAALLWLAALYPLNFGMLAYLAGREHLSDAAAEATMVVYLPLIRAAEEVPAIANVLEPFVDWCYDLGDQHAGGPAVEYVPGLVTVPAARDDEAIGADFDFDVSPARPASAADQSAAGGF